MPGQVGARLSARSLRRSAAEAGATVAQLEAIFGWSGTAMASLYTEAADRKRLALEAMHKLANETETSLPAPDDKVRAQSEKLNEINGLFFGWCGREDSNLHGLRC